MQKIEKKISMMKKKLYTVRFLVIVFLPVMLITDTYTKNFNLNSSLIFPVFIAFAMGIGALHISILYEICPFCGETFQIKSKPHLYSGSLWSFSCKNCGKSVKSYDPKSN